MDADEVGLGTSEGIERGIVVLFESKAIVDATPTDGVGIFNLVSLNVRESVMEMVDVRLRVNSRTDVVDIRFWKSSTATAEMTTVVVEGEDTVGKFENRVPKAVKVEVTAAKLSPRLATAWTPVNRSRATIYPGTWKTATDFMTCNKFLVQTCRKDVRRVLGEKGAILAE